MVQLDGSHHVWLEGRGPALVLMAYIGDATNHVFARFYDYEGTLPTLDSFARYVRRYGLPQSQFERAVTDLGVTPIPAYSPQGRTRSWLVQAKPRNCRNDESLKLHQAQWSGKHSQFRQETPVSQSQLPNHRLQQQRPNERPSKFIFPRNVPPSLDICTIDQVYVEYRFYRNLKTI